MTQFQGTGQKPPTAGKEKSEKLLITAGKEEWTSHGQGLHLEGVNDDEALGGAPGGTAGWGNFWDDWTVDEAPALKGVTVGAAIL